MKSTSNIVPKLLGVLLLTGAVLKGWQLLTEPTANNDIWTNRAFLIFTVEFEISLGIWLLSGLFKKAAWLAALSCFSLFSFITLYKGLSGAESCGCFGSVHVNPWITLFAIDIPAVIALVIFRPKGKKLFDWPSIPRFATTVTIGLVILGITIPMLALNEPAKISSSYEVLEPGNWVGRKLPILEHIDIAKSLQEGTWVMLLYHHDCPDCVAAIPMYEQMAYDIKGNEDFLRITLIEVPPYCPDTGDENCLCTHGCLANTKEWLVTTPIVVLMTDGWVKETWEVKVPDLNTILEKLTSIVNRPGRFESYSEILAKNIQDVERRWI
ncbi:MAG: hypothetical protein JXB29_02275 [Sedimentisphaerales bacterium]|nr:hypothetical protein [Sedimentisphaerales bacterium]